MNRSTPIAKSKYQQLLALANSNASLHNYMHDISLDELNLLFNEASTDMERLLSRLSYRVFHHLMEKLQFGKRDKRNIKISKLEWIFNLVGWIASISIPAAGLALAIATNGWLLMATLGVIFLVATLSASSNIYGLHEQNAKALNRKKLINLQVEIKKEIIRREFIEFLNYLLVRLLPKHTVKYEIKRIKSALYKGSISPHDAFLMIKFFINKNKKDIKHNKKIQQRFNQFAKQIKQSNLSQVFDKNEIRQPNIIDVDLVSNPLGFKRWWRANKGIAIANTITEKNDPSPTLKLLTLANFFIVAASFAGAATAIGFLSGPYGIPIIVGVAAISLIAVGGIAIYKLYRQAKRQHEFELTKEILDQQEESHQELLNMKKTFKAKIKKDLDEPMDAFQVNRNKSESHQHKSITPSISRSTSQPQLYRKKFASLNKKQSKQLFNFFNDRKGKCIDEEEHILNLNARQQMV